MTDLMTRRTAFLGPNMPTFYDRPIHLVRGQGVHVWDAAGRQYLDCYNNVPHVGHCHPKVVDAITQQASTLNTHTRYLHDGIVDYAERLTAKFDHDLDQLIMVCTGSEANDIAIRMAHAVTGKVGIISTDNTYHGNTHLVTQLSSRKPPIGGYAPYVKRVPSPDTLRPLGGSLAAQGAAFATEVQTAIDALESEGHGFAGFMFCPVFANEGLHDLDAEFLQPVVDVVHRAGGLLLCDEVQPGFGRCGSHWWGHDRMAIAPDVVTIGKPMANGHPVASVVTRPDVMAAFRNAFGYFNTFGGNPVSCAAASAVLDIIEEEHLVENAHKVGSELTAHLASMDHPLVANVRGVGLFVAVEIERDGTPAMQDAAHVVEAMKNRSILMGRTGRHGNTLKFRPPMPFSSDNAAQVAEALTDVLKDMP